MSTFSAAVRLQKSVKLKGGYHPVVLQIIFNKKVRFIRLGHKAKLDQWDIDRFRRGVRSSRRLNKELDQTEDLANEIYYKYFGDGFFDYKEYAKIFKEGDKDITVFEFFDQIVQSMKNKNRGGTAMSYRDIKNILLKYIGTTEFYFTDITYRWLDKFESDLLQRGCTGGGISAYMRTIKALYNKAIKHGLVDQKHYPFNSQLNRCGYSFSHLKSQKSYRALSLEDMDKLKTYSPTLDEQLAYYLFMFSYYSFGTNFTDIAHLKPSHFHEGHLVYFRKKTKEPVMVPITQESQRILDYFEKHRVEHNEYYLLGHPSSYLFPILSDYHEGDSVRIKDRTKKVITKVNKRLKQIAQKLGIEKNITFYVARHCAATIAKRKGASVEQISELMGHSNTIITQVYLSKFAGSELDSAVKLL